MIKTLTAAFLAGYLLKESASVSPEASPHVPSPTVRYNRDNSMGRQMRYLADAEGFRTRPYTDPSRPKDSVPEVVGYGTNMKLHKDRFLRYMPPEQYDRVLSGQEDIDRDIAGKIKRDFMDTVYNRIASEIPADKEYLIPGLIGANFQGKTPKAVTHAASGNFTDALMELSPLGYRIPERKRESVQQRYRNNMREFFTNLAYHNPEAALKARSAYALLLRMPLPRTEQERQARLNIFNNVIHGRMPGRK